MLESSLLAMQKSNISGPAVSQDLFYLKVVLNVNSILKGIYIRK